MSRLSIVAAAAALALAGCDTVPGLGLGAPAANTTPVIASAYVAMAASGDQYEIRSSQLALQRSQDQRHRSFADMMIREHGVTSAQLTAAAQAVGIAVPPQMDVRHVRMLDELSRAPNFDAVYHRQQITAHEMAVALHSNYAARGDNAQLRGYAALTAPVVRRHLDQMRTMM